jgi:carbamate kinase
MNTSLQRLVATHGSGPSIGLELPVFHADAGTSREREKDNALAA